MELIKQYIIGEGVTGIASGHRTSRDTGEFLEAFIVFHDIEKTETGRDLSKDENRYDFNNPVSLLIKNLEGLAVIEEAVANVRKSLEEKL